MSVLSTSPTPPQTITARLLAALPESVWTEAVRRLRLVPELWNLAEDGRVLRAYGSLGGDTLHWQPSSIALAAYSAERPECAGDAEAWLSGAGREHVNQGYIRLADATARLHPLDDALPAALALRLRGYATGDWAAMAGEASRQPERWRLPLQYLWGLVDSPDALFTALLESSPSGAELAGQCLVVNLAAPEAVEFVCRLSPSTRADHWLSFARAIESMGAATYARALIREVATRFRGEASGGADVDTALLLAATGDFSLAGPALTEAWSRTRKITATLAGHIGRLALLAGDTVSALAGYQDALAEAPGDPELRTGLARALIALNQPNQALATLNADAAGAAFPALLVASARAQSRLGLASEAHSALQRLHPDELTEADLLAEAAQLCHELGDLPLAIKLMQRSAAVARIAPERFLAAAQWLLKAERWAEACEMATEAAALAPQDAQARELLGGTLLACRAPAQALKHFRAAIAFEPTRLSAGLGLARAALAAAQPTVAREAVQHILDTASEPDVVGEAHVLMGQALSDLHQDDEAFEHFHRASALVPSAPEPWRAMARHYQQRGEQDQALAALEAGRQALALVTSPDIGPLLSDLADQYERMERNTDAILALREACAADAHMPNELLRLGALLRKQGYASDSIDVLRQALRLRPGDAIILHELGLSLEKIGKVDDAWSAYQQAVLERPTHPEPYLDLGRVTLMQCRKAIAGASPLQAVSVLREAVQRAPEAAEAHALLAQAYQLAGDADDALASYQRALHLAPTRTDWSLGLGQVCLDLHKSEVAIAALLDALAHAPDDPAVHASLASAYAQSELWPESQQAAESGMRFDPENPALCQLAAEASVHLGQMESAVEAWHHAVNINPRDAQMQIRYARCLLDMGRADEARAVYAQALSLAPEAADVHLAVGDAFLELGEIDSALDVLQQAAQLAPRSAQAQAALGKAALAAGKYEAAHAAYLQAAEIEPGSIGYLREAGEALWAMGRMASAVALWQRALNVDVDDHATLVRLGIGLVRLGQYVDALGMLGRAAHQNPYDPIIAREAARAAIALSQFDRASEYLERVVQLSPGDAEVRFMLGQICEQGGEVENALAHYRQATRLSPGDGAYLAASADALARQGDREEAIKLMDDALATSPDSPDVQRRAGQLFLEVGRPADAAHVFQHLVAARPRDAEAHLALAKALVLQAEVLEHEDRTGLREKRPQGKTGPLEDATAQVMQSLQQAAVLGADPQTVRFWMGRAKAVTGEAQEARQLLESLTTNAAAPHFNGADLHRALGEALRKAGDLERARDVIQIAIQSDAHQAVNHLELGLTLAALGDRREAVQAFRQAATLAPAWAIAHDYLAEALLAIGDRPEAAQALQRAVALRPEAAAWHHRLARVYQMLREVENAIAHFQRATELEPANPNYAADLARALARDGDLATAADLFRRATDANPDHAPLWVERGQALLALNDFATAAECFAQGMRLDPANVAALTGGARASLALGDVHDAGNKAETAARLAPDQPETLICLADVQMTTGDLVDAESNYIAAATSAKDPGPSLLALGRLYFAQKKLDKATDVLARAAAANPESDEIYAALGDVRQTAGNLDSAVTAYREAVRISPRNPKHLLRLGRACRAQGQLDQSLSHLVLARETAPDDDEVLREIGLVFEQRKQYDRALEAYQHAIQVAPRTSLNHTRAGAALKQMKDYAGAVAALERAVSLDPKNLEATKQLAVVSALNLMHGEQRVRV